MNILSKCFSRLRSPDSSRPPHTVSQRRSEVEHLERRICLGGLTSVAGGPAAEITTGPQDAQFESDSFHQPGGSSAGNHDLLANTPRPPAVPQPPAHPVSSEHTSARHEAGPEITGTSPSLLFQPLPDAGSSSRTNAPATPASATGSWLAMSPDSTAGSSTIVAAGSTGTSSGPSIEIASQMQAAGQLAQQSEIARDAGVPWWITTTETTTIRYDFRDQNGVSNTMTEEMQAAAILALETWSTATDGKVQFVRDEQAEDSEIVNIGVGDLSALGHRSGAGGTLALGGGIIQYDEAGQVQVTGVAWLDEAETWDIEIGNGNPADTHDFFTVMAHETGHVLGYGDSYASPTTSIMDGIYDVERGVASVEYAALNGEFSSTIHSPGSHAQLVVHPMMTGFPQLVGSEVEQLLDRAAAATASEDAIIAVVDRNGRILGVRVEAGVLATITDPETLVFAIDGAVAKARTAAFFSNGDPTNGTLAPLTSRLVRFISQSTITQREVESNPNAELSGGSRTVGDVNASTEYGPGFVAPIGLGGHFPPGVPFTPPVDLFGIEHTNRDGSVHPGADGIKGTGDDITLAQRFNIDPAFVPTGQELAFQESYGVQSGLLPNAQSRGIATLPGGIPIFRDQNSDGVGETLIGGIGVFFPGSDGYATHEQGFVPGIGQTPEQRINAPRVLESEYIAFAAVGGSAAAAQHVGGAQIGEINGVARVAGLDLPFGRLDLVGIQLEVVGPIAGELGVEQLLEFGRSLGVGDPSSGANQTVSGGDTVLDGQSVPEGWLVTPHDSATDDITAADVEQIISQALLAAHETRAAVRLPLNSETRMVFAVTDTTGEILGLFRMKDATVFSIDVAIAKARNTAYYADATALQPFDQVDGVAAGTAMTNRTFRFLSEPRFPDGIDATQPPAFSILGHPGIDPGTGENIGGPAAAGTFNAQVSPGTSSVLGYDSFFPNTNFQDPGNPANENGIVFFPGSTPLYKNGTLIGGFGVSGDGVDQDDVVTFLGAQHYLPSNGVQRADQVSVRGVRLPYIKFLRNPFGGVNEP